MTAILVCIATGACVETETVPFEVELTQKQCIEEAAGALLSRVELLLILIEQSGSLCLLERAEVKAAERASREIEGGVFEAEEVVLAGLAFDSSDCIRCHALARVKLSSELRRYPIELVPSQECVVPDAALQGLALPLDDFPPAACR